MILDILVGFGALFMNRSVVAGASFIALAAVNPAFAAPPAIYNWTGFYVGGNVGYSFGKADTNLSDPSFTEFGSGFGLPGAFPAMLHPDGVIGGGQLDITGKTARPFLVLKPTSRARTKKRAQFLVRHIAAMSKAARVP